MPECIWKNNLLTLVIVFIAFVCSGVWSILYLSSCFKYYFWNGNSTSWVSRGFYRSSFYVWLVPLMIGIGIQTLGSYIIQGKLIWGSGTSKQYLLFLCWWPSSTKVSFEMQLITFVTLLKVDINLLSFLIRSVDIEADDHNNGRKRAENRLSTGSDSYCFIE